MKKRLSKKIICISILVAVLCGLAASLIHHYRDIIFGPPVFFKDDNYISIGLYPYNHKSAVVFTIDDVYKLTEPEKILNLTTLLERYGYKVVFFVIPYYRGRYKITSTDPVTKALIDITNRGNEVGLHGLTHHIPHYKVGVANIAREFAGLPYGEQKRRIYVGRKILEDCGLKINGFRAPAYSADRNTLEILEHLDFLYGANAAVYPPPYEVLGKRRFVESVYYPYHPAGLNLVEFVSHGDFFRTHLNPKNFIIMKTRFERIYKYNGTFILYSHIELINTPPSIKLLTEMLNYLDTKDIWKPSLTELALWWKAREELYADTEIEGNTLTIKLEKGNELNLDGLTITFKKYIPAENYKIVNEEGTIIKKGSIKEGVVVINY